MSVPRASRRAERFRPVDPRATEGWPRPARPDTSAPGQDAPRGRSREFPEGPPRHG